MPDLFLRLVFFILAALPLPGSALCKVPQCQAKFVYNVSQSVSCRTLVEDMECGRQLMTNPNCSHAVKDYVRGKLSQGQLLVDTICKQVVGDCDVQACLDRIVVNVNRSVHCRTMAQASWCLQVSVLHNQDCSSNQSQCAQEMTDKMSGDMLSNCPSGSPVGCDPLVCLEKSSAAGHNRNICNVARAFLSCVDTDIIQEGGCTRQQQADIQEAKSIVSKYLSSQHSCTGAAGSLTLISTTLTVALALSLTYIRRTLSLSKL